MAGGAWDWIPQWQLLPAQRECARDVNLSSPRITREAITHADENLSFLSLTVTTQGAFPVSVLC